MNYITWEQAVQWLREQPDQQELVRACYYDDPLLDAAKRFSESEEWQAVISLLPSPGNALDIGAGRGISSYALAVSGWQVTALEPDPSDLVGTGAIHTLVRQTKLPINIVQESAEEMDFEDGMFSLVYGREVLHHAINLKEMLKRIARVLKPGGIFLACREHVLSEKTDLDAFLKAHPLHHLYGGENAYLLDEYTTTIRDSGLRMKNIYGPYDSVINYFPVPQDELLAYILQPVRKLIGLKLILALAKNERIKKMFFDTGLSRLASQRDHTPGRLFTFVAMKSP